MADFFNNDTDNKDEEVSKIKLGEVEYTAEELEGLVADGKFKRELVRGIWWEKCDPLRRSTRKFRLKKLSSVLLERRMFFLRG